MTPPGAPPRAPIAEELVWARVVRPQAPLVYLDLNHYILLARANPASSTGAEAVSKTGKALPAYADLLAAARAASRAGRAIFPLSGVHLLELARVADPRQRYDVATVMEELSEFTYLLGRTTIAELEMDAGLDRIYGEDAPMEPLPLLGPSFARAFGRAITLKVKYEDGSDASDEVREQLGADEFDKPMSTLNVAMEREMLRGPTDAQIPALRARGWDPEGTRASHQSRLEFELETKELLDSKLPQWRSGRLRDIVSFREVDHEWMDLYVRLLQERERLGWPHDLLTTEESMRFWPAMPQAQVAISMKTRYHRNAARAWKTNDISDIDAMAVAYPYCDVVFTDREARAALHDSPELRSFGTYLPKKPDELASWLNDLPEPTESGLLVPHPLPTTAHGDE